MGPGSASAADLPVGRILLDRGDISEEQLREVLALQREMQRMKRPVVPLLGEMLVQRGYATTTQLQEALALQGRRLMFCPSCELHLYVERAAGTQAYRCGRCQTALVDPPQDRPVNLAESSVLYAIRDPLPPEVHERLSDADAKFGKYVLVKELGRGGVGIVYKAWDTYLGQFVALKRLKSPAAGRGEPRETHVVSLLKEARSAVRLRHPHIATVYDVGRVGREFYMSMEYLEGSTLSKHVEEARKAGRLSPFYASPHRYLRAMRDVARATHYAHSRPAPVIHCDLKPSNIFIDQTDRAYVLDFGLARNLRNLRQEPSGAVSGTPSYMAPEQAAGKTEDIDARTDVYGLGAILYELLAGRPPFLGSMQSVLRQALSETPERPIDVIAAEREPGVRIHIPEGLEEVCLRCLEKDRAMRFQTAHEFAEALDQVLKGSAHAPVPSASTPRAVVVLPTPVTAPPARPAAPLRRHAGRRSAAMFGLGALAAALLVGVTLVAVWPDRAGSAAIPLAICPDRLHGHAVAFRSDAALAEWDRASANGLDPIVRARLAALIEDLRWMDLGRARAVEAINAARFDKSDLKLAGSTLAGARVTQASAAGLVVTVDGRLRDIPWCDLDPDCLLDLAEAASREYAPPERLGLAIFARLTGRRERAKALLQTLQETDLAQVAARYRD